MVAALLAAWARADGYSAFTSRTQGKNRSNWKSTEVGSSEAQAKCVMIPASSSSSTPADGLQEVRHPFGP